MTKPIPVVIEIDEEGVTAVYSDHPAVRVIVVDHGWEEAIEVSCPFAEAGSLQQCHKTIRRAVEAVTAHPDHPRSVAKPRRYPKEIE